MKKFLALAVAVVMTAALFAVAVNAAADPAIIITAEQLASESNATKSGVHFELVEEGGEKFARFTADDKDPHLYLSPEIVTDVANHYAAIKYRTTSGAATIDAYMAGAEPHTMFEAITADGEWHVTIGDLEQSGANWTGKFARLDPMNGGTLEVGDTIDIAWIALFTNESDARAYTGPSGSSPVEPAPVKDADAWLCEAGGPVATGWWMHPFADQQWEFNAKCTSPSAFDGIIALFYANPEGATVKINLLDANGKILETVEHTQKGDGTVTLDFSKAYPAGTYTIQILSTSNGAHFVVGSSNAGAFPVEISGNCNTNENTLVAPIIVLRGAVPPAESGNTPSNPHSGDAAIIAIAAVGCVALAGVVVAKKAK